ncbi:MAG TPA: hypothetical protein VFU05_08000 [Cyclobacteriaceae bacterium]|nr:hypothetical protein [Cyclobacteriaceae bacterium]
MNKDLRNSFLISFAYVGLGTLALLFINSSSVVVPIILLITVPVTFIGFGIAYMESNSIVAILLTQAIVFLIFWAVLYRILKKGKTK